MLRLRARPWFSISGAGITLVPLIACIGAASDRSVYAAAVLGILSAMFGAIAFKSGAVAIGAIHRALIKLDFERI
jgi:imidazole glycerol phosphate synthase subunit HisF